MLGSAKAKNSQRRVLFYISHFLPIRDVDGGHRGKLGALTVRSMFFSNGRQTLGHDHNDL